MDSNGEYVTDFNISSWNYSTVYDQIADLNPTMDIPFNPEYFSLLKAYPNPFNPTINITFSISQSSQAVLAIYDIGGSYLETISQSYFTAGNYTFLWNASEYASGIYFVKLDTDFITLSRKLVLTK